MHNPIIAILAAGLAGWIFGAVWYGVLGKPWQRAQGLNPEDCKGKKMPLNLLVVSFLAALVMSATLYYLLGSMGMVGVGPSALMGLTIGVGLIAVSLLVNNLFQQRHFTLTVIDGGHWAGALAIEAAIIALLA
jgi:hypothetical protein